MAYTASICRRLSFWTVVCGVALLIFPYYLSAVSAAAVPQDTIPLEIEPGSWVINEIHADPAGELTGDANGDGLSDPTQDEFIELFNNTGDVADISGWSLSDKFSLRHQFPEGTIVPDRCAIVVFGGGTPSGEFGGSLIQIASSGSLGLDDSGDTITLSNDAFEISSVSYGLEGNDDQALTRNPDVSGMFEGHLTASAPLETRFSPGTRLDGTIFWGCPGYNAPPTVQDIQPANGAPAVSIDSSIAVTFSESVFLTEPWYEILCTATGVHTAVTNGATDSIILVPVEPFAYSESCRVTLFSAAIEDVDGQPMETDFQWQFKTETEGDQAPEIIDSYPVDGALGVPLAPVLTLTFSEPVDLAETAVTLTCSQSLDIALHVSSGPSHFNFQPETDLAPGELCTLSIDGAGVSDQDLDDPPDQMASNWQIQFNTDVSSLMLINEIDSETPGIDDAEFIELFDGGGGNTTLDGLSLVLFSGHDDSVYASFDLDGLQTDDSGFFLLGSSSVTGVDQVMSDSLLQNGPDAVALYRADAAAFPIGAAITTENLIDALVYDTGQETDVGLLPLLLAGELPANEKYRDLDDLHSLQRCPNASGGQRRTSTYWPDWPTPKEENTCIKDDAPLITGTIPTDGTINVPLESGLTITFNEEVDVYNDWFQITCENSGIHDASVSGGGYQFDLQPLIPFAYGEKCQVTLFAEMINDLDSNDPPNHPDGDYSWFFTTTPARHVVINEVDADTEGIDSAEFIELFDGGSGSTALDGLLVVLFNGADDLSYRAIDLSEQQTDESGRFVIGNSAVSGVQLVLPDSTLQNGPDAVALYAGQVEDFPNGSAITMNNLLDAVVYGTNDESDSGLLVLLADGQGQVDEDGRENGQGDSSQRCPDGSGGQRHSDSFSPNLPTPGDANKCTYDTAPFVTGAAPDDQTVDTPLSTSVVITFSEPVDLLEGWIDFFCQKSGTPEIDIRQSGNEVTIKPKELLSYDEACTVTVSANRVVDRDTEDPPDQLAADFVLHFQTIPYPPSTQILINEVDADTAGIDSAEFIELYDGGEGNTVLDGLVIVLFNGSTDLTYAAYDLDGYQTDGEGYFLLGNSSLTEVTLVIPNGTIQNGPDAVALFAGNADDFPNGTAVSTDQLLDALVYSTGDESVTGLLPLLLPGEENVDEDGRGAKDSHSNQRCPNGAGGQRRTVSYLQNKPTPNKTNFCEIDEPPQISSHTPLTGAYNIAQDTNISLSFSEEVFVDDRSVQLFCTKSGNHYLTASGGPLIYQFTPDTPLSAGESCSVTLFGDGVSDLDTNDPPDLMVGDYAWTFDTVPIPVARHIVINEVDADTKGIDTAEFIELFDGGDGNTLLDGLVVVLFNGSDDLAYAVYDLDGYQTDEQGYFLLGNIAVAGKDLVLPDSILQNGADAVALYAAKAEEFPSGSAITMNNLLDAVVYGTNDEPDTGLLVLLTEGQAQIDEDGRENGQGDSNQRCPNGSGGQRYSNSFLPNLPTPGDTNKCTYDAAPFVSGSSPEDQTVDAPLDTSVIISFSEPVNLLEGWFKFVCEKAGTPEINISQSGNQVTLIPRETLPYNDACAVTVSADHVLDSDTEDPPDQMTNDFVLRFQTIYEIDEPPEVIGHSPLAESRDIAVNSHISITFNEDVVVDDRSLQLLCSKSGDHSLSTSGGPLTFQFTPDAPLSAGETCSVTLFGDRVSDVDDNDPPDLMVGDYAWSFDTAPVPIARHLVINEVDADTNGVDTAEFIELFDGGEGNTLLDGLIIVLFNGSDDLSYATYDLDGLRTDGQGYFLLGNTAVAGTDLVLANSTLQNGPDAVALYAEQVEEFSNGSAITTSNLLDAVVYGTNDEPDNGLLVLLADGQAQIDEDGRDNGSGDSSQRCPDGSGGQRYSNSFLPNLPTPGETNKCTYDAAPFVVSASPDDQTVDAPLDTSVIISFSEPVNLLQGWFKFVCEKAETPEVNISQSGNQVTLKPQDPLPYNDACTVTVSADYVVDSDTEDPPDQLPADFVLHFQTMPHPPATQILINEVDADTVGIDTAEFIELYDGGVGNTLLDGLVVVLFNGSSGLSYAAFDLDGYQTDAHGYFLLGNPAVGGVRLIFSDGTLQNGPDAAALFVGNADDFPNGSVISTNQLLDALVYSTGDESVSGLLPLLLSGEEIIDEDGRGAKDNHSNQRCPNGAGGQRRTASYLQNKPTPNTENFCEIDEPPVVSGHSPPVEGRNVAVDSHISITFNEEVILHDGSLRLLCTKSGEHDQEVSIGPTIYQFALDTPLSAGETCSVTLFGDKVSDLDDNDPPDQMIGDYTWSFETVPIPVARHVLINEVDADTEGVDTAEFIELFDGGDGNTPLDGLEIFLINGSDDQVYRRIDLAGHQTDVMGYFVIGGSAVPGVHLVIPNGTIQNGPDAVALYDQEASVEIQPGQTGLLDALVYLTNDEPAPGLQFLLLEGESQVDEGTWRDPTVDSNQRCPNGQGGQRVTSGYVQNLPTPGATNQCRIDKPPYIVQVHPADGTLDAAVNSSLSVSFDEPVQTAEGWIELSCKEGGTIELYSSGGPQDYTIQPETLKPFDTCKATVNKEKVFDLDSYADELTEDYVWQFSTGKPLAGVCGDDATPIHAVQGSAEKSPLLDMEVIIEGVVVAVYQGEKNLNGFFLQEEIEDMDGDPLTSEGLFIVDGPIMETVTSGDILRLQGEVFEANGMTSLENISSWQHCGSEMAVEPQIISLPLDNHLSWENLEGMLVTFDQTITVVDNDRWGSDGIVGLASERLYYPTMLTYPGQAAQNAAENNQKLRITLDDGSMVVNPLPYPPYLGPGNTLRLGDTVENLTGIVADSLDRYRIQPSKSVLFNRENPRPPLAPLIPGRMRVVHIHAGGLFNGDGHGQVFLPGLGAQSSVEYERQIAKLVSAILDLDASVIGLTGIENDGYGEASVVKDLTNALNEAAEEGQYYQAIEVSGGEQRGFAEAAVLIYRKDIVSPIGNAKTILEYPFKELSIRPLAQQFSSITSGQEILVVVTQFPGRGNCPLEGDPNADQGDGQACWNKLREEAAGILAEWVIKQQAESGVEVLVVGEFNTYAKENPLQILVDTGLSDVEVQNGDEVNYAAVFNGLAGTLNYGFVTTGLEGNVALVQRWHINADEPAALDYRETNQPLLYSPDPYRSASQDPLVIDLSPDELSAAFSCNQSVWIGEPVSFTNLSHGPKPLAYEWDFGDGAPLSTKAEPVHLYEHIGTYTVTLRVKTNWGETAVYNAQIEVLPVRTYLPIIPQER